MRTAFCVACLFAVPAVAAEDLGFELKFPTKTVLLLSGGQVEFVGKKPKKIPAPVPVHWGGFFEITRHGKPPADGVFDVNGKPLKPTISIVPQANKRAAARVEIFDDGGRTVVAFSGIGKTVFRAEVGKVWRKDATIEVKQLPIWSGMKVADALERYGYPDDRLKISNQSLEFWTYAACPGYLVEVFGSPGEIGRLTHESQIPRDVAALIAEARAAAKTP